MGTDIHGRIQSRWNDNHKWHDSGEIERDRNYLMFAILANVRNGSGFAGVATHEPIVPIDEPRGLPDDADDVAQVWTTGNTKADVECDYGEHSQSWLLLSEILAWPHWNDGLARTGVVSRAEYDRIQKEGGPPKDYCGGISGRDVIVARSIETAPENWTHLHFDWIEESIKAQCAPYWEWFQYLNAKYGGGNCRIVFGFDS
jgi:hypothetical protein